MSIRLKILLVGLLFIGLFSGLMGCFQTRSVEDSVPRISKEELKAMLDNPGVVIIDVRVGEDWKMADLRIKGAVREDPGEDPRIWAGKYSKDKTIVFYCA